MLINDQAASVTADAVAQPKPHRTLTITDILAPSREPGSSIALPLASGFDLAAATAGRVALSKHKRATERLTSIPVGRPNAKLFVRINPALDFRTELTMFKAPKGFNPLYVVYACAVGKFDPNDLDDYAVYTGVDVDGDPFVWPVRISGEHANSWTSSAHDAIDEAMGHWVRVITREGVQSYVTERYQENAPEPIFPPLTFLEILTLAFADRQIRTGDEPIVKRLYGRAS